VTAGKNSLDDVMRLAYKRYAGERGFTPDQFRAAAEEVAGVDLKDWFRKAIRSTDELDYADALDWYGLRFAPPEETEKNTEAKKDETKKEEAKKKESARKWRLEVGTDATEAQKRHLQGLLEPSSSATRPLRRDLDRPPARRPFPIRAAVKVSRRMAEDWPDRRLRRPGRR